MANDLAAPFGEPHRYLDVGHSRIAHWRLGRGPDLVFVHGWPLHAATFRRVAPLLSQDFTLHLLDLPGAGRTISNPDAPIDIASHGVTLRRVVQALGLTRYAFMAHDSGAVAARLAAVGDDRLTGLVIGNSEVPGHHPWLLKVYVLMAQRAVTSRLMLSGMRVRALRRSKLGFGGCFADPSYGDGEFGDLFVTPLLGSLEASRGQIALVRNLDFSVVDGLKDAHAQIRAPVLCIWGPGDPFFPIEKARAMLAQFGGGASLAEIPGAKLFAHEDFPEQFAAHARAFLSSRFAA